MEWLFLVAVLGAVGGAVWAMVHRAAGQQPPDDELAEVLGEAGEELEERLVAVAGEELDALRRALRRRLAGLRDRAVPLRAISPTPWRSVGRIAFADGTVLLARTRTPGDLAVVAMWQRGGAVTVAGYRDHPDGVEIDLAQSPHRRCSVIGIGLDQSD